MKTILKLESVSLSYHTKDGEVPALKNVSFEVKSGEFVSVIGPSGCGKTSILSLIAGLIKPDEGRIVFNEKEVKKPDKAIGYMLQRDELFPWRTIEQNVFLPLEISKNKDASRKKEVLSLLDKYGLKDFKRSYPQQLSGGMRQRAALIRTLSTSPDLLLLDEPFSALDYQTRLAVCDDVYSIIKNENKTAVLVTHDISEAIATSDKIIALTKRPSSILDIHVTETDKTLSPLKRREDANFGKTFEILWRELNDEN
ncbi:MAG: ABC transporter ATP-binding protein [Clostridia bacterium]|nr:ABC transporter ATP-binding protein [Clostridia bacterium]